jgi:hypothetical protein
MRARRTFDLLAACNSAHLFKPWFKNPDHWASWFAFIAALFALPMTPDQLAVYQACTGRSEPPTEPASEGWLVCGRRAGKSFILALCAVYLAAFRDYRPFLAPGERATVLVIATDRKQARVIFRYITALLTRVPMLKRMIERETAEGFDLTNSVTIEVGTASMRTTRGYTFCGVLLDEAAFFATDDAAEPDYEIINAVLPGFSTIPGAMLLCASSPYARRGALWDAHRRHFGKDGDPILVWQAATRVMNPTVPQRVIDAATERDPASAAAEYGAQFRTDIESYITREAVENCVTTDVHERPPLANVNYVGFVDPSGGSADSMTLAIAHREDDVAVLDALRERKPPFSPEDVVSEFATLLKTYRINAITGDRYAGEWPRERFKVHGIAYEPAPKPKSDLYRDLLPSINSGKLDLLDHAKLITQLVSLERRTARGGRDSIDHPPGGHDDIANVVAGVVVSLGLASHEYDTSLKWVGSGLEATDDWHRQGLYRHIMFHGGLR